MKTRIYIALLAVILIVAGIVNTPNALEIARSQLAIIYLFGKTLVGLVTEPGCYGLIGFAILALVIGSIRIKRQQRREDFERKMQELRESKNPIKNFAGKVIESVDEKINLNIRLPQTFETWERWQRYYAQYRIIKTSDKRLNEKEILARLCSELSTDFEIVKITDKTMRDIRKAGGKGYLTTWEKFCEMTGRQTE